MLIVIVIVVVDYIVDSCYLNYWFGLWSFIIVFIGNYYYSLNLNIVDYFSFFFIIDFSCLLVSSMVILN